MKKVIFKWCLIVGCVFSTLTYADGNDSLGVSLKDAINAIEGNGMFFMPDDLDKNGKATKFIGKSTGHNINSAIIEFHGNDEDISKGVLILFPSSDQMINLGNTALSYRFTANLMNENTEATSWFAHAIKKITRAKAKKDKTLSTVMNHRRLTAKHQPLLNVITLTIEPESGK